MDKITFGKYKGQYWGDIPGNYLFYLIDPYLGFDKQIVKYATKELEKRGFPVYEVKISNRAIDKASIVCFDKFNNRQNKSKGIYSWLLNLTLLAIENGIPIDANEEIIEYNGIVFKFKKTSSRPILTTVYTKN